ncbi:hypothetical protein GCM10028812_14680 [Ancylobacter sonchi]
MTDEVAGACIDISKGWAAGGRRASARMARAIDGAAVQAGGSDPQKKAPGATPGAEAGTQRPPSTAM